MKMRELIFFIFRRIIAVFWGSKLTRFPPIHWGFRFLHKHLRSSDPIIIETEGRKMYVCPTTVYDCNLSLLYGVYDTPMSDLFKREIKPGMTVVDLGAHIGYYTLLTAKLVGEKGKVFSFEPAPDNYALLTKNIAINGYKNVTPVPKAVSNKIDKVKLALRDQFTHYVCDSNDVKGEFVLVECTSLDEFFADEDMQIDLVKMNIEGSEMAALEGMSNLIKKNESLKIVTEFCPDFLRRAGSSPEEFLHKLMEYGFKFCDIHAGRKTDVDSVLKAYKGDGLAYLLCARDG